LPVSRLQPGNDTERPLPVKRLDEPKATIWQGDSRDALKVMERSSVSLVVTSPPYPGVPQPEDDYFTFEDPMAFNAAHDILAEVWQVCFELLEDKGWMVINLYDIPMGEDGMYPNVAAVQKRCLDIGFVIREQYIWWKGTSYSPPSGSWPYPKGLLSANNWEPCLVFQKPLQFKQRRKDPSDYTDEQRARSLLSREEHAWLTDGVWRIPVDREARALGHPFTYPLALVERFVRLYSFADDVVFDPFVGGGTTVRAAELHGRHGIGFELSDKYIGICRKLLQTGSLFGG
jgi:DNA modification methylase